MKLLIAVLLGCGVASAQAAENDLIQRAVRCELKDKELASLMQQLASENKGFVKPTRASGALPSFDHYEIAAPASAYGYSSTEVVVMPARILIAVKGSGLPKVVQELKLEESDFSPASKPVRPTVNVVAMELSLLPDRVLIGCEYANNAAARWVRDIKLF